MLDVERFLEACRGAVAGTDPERAVRELMTEAMADPAQVAAARPEPRQAGFTILPLAPNLTVLDFTWAPWMCFKPHDHCMWSVVGIFSGREDNLFWRQRGGTLEAAGARSLGAGEITYLGTDIIHSVVNPIGKMTRAIHVYGGDFFDPPRPRREWDPETLHERTWDLDDQARLFVEADARPPRAERQA